MHRTLLTALLALTSFSVANAQTEVKGFVNPSYHWATDAIGNLSTAASTDANGFLLNDAALYVSHTAGKASLFIDLPFAADGAATDGSFAFAKAKAQGYVAYAFNDQWKVTLGQFDTLYGYELNDAKDRFFTKTGIVYDHALNVTHTGAVVESVWGPVTVKVLSANRENGSNPSANNAEYGAQITYKTDAFYVTVGHLASEDNTVATDNESTLTDIIVGTTVGQWTLDAEHVSRARVGSDEKDSWILLHAIYGINDHCKLGLRLEQGSNYFGTAGAEEVDLSQYALAYRHIENENFYAQIEVAVQEAEYDPAIGTVDSEDNTIARISGVYTF